MKRRQRGVALALVLWFVAAMALVVAGIVAHSRVDGRTTQLHLARAKAVAAGDGAIALAMLDRSSGFDPQSSGPLVSQSIQRVGELDVLVLIYPASGLVDVNYAPGQLLAALFHHAGGLSPAEAQSVADNVVKWRENKEGTSRRTVPTARRFHSMEDMLRVDGVTRTLLDGVRDYAVAGDWTRGGMDWGAAPENLLPVLEAVSPEQAGTARERRDTLASRASGQSGDNFAGGNAFRADALIEYGGRTWLRRRWLQLGSGASSSLPWHVVRTEPPRVVKG